MPRSRDTLSSMSCRFAADNDLFCSIDANRGDYQNGWDTDQFPINLYEIIEAMIVIIEAGGFTSGGINFDAKNRRNSTDLDDIFIAHIAGMDVFARAFEITHDLLANSPFMKMRKERYASYDSGAGAKFENGELSLERCGSWLSRTVEMISAGVVRSNYQSVYPLTT